MDRVDGVDGFWVVGAGTMSKCENDEDDNAIQWANCNHNNCQSPARVNRRRQDNENPLT